jgi:hypothetical protein
VERAERSGGLHKRSAEDWGVACGREGIPPLSSLCCCACSCRTGVAGRVNRSARWVAEGRGAHDRKETSSRRPASASNLDLLAYLYFDHSSDTNVDRAQLETDRPRTFRSVSKTREPISAQEGVDYTNAGGVLTFLGLPDLKLEQGPNSCFHDAQSSPNADMTLNNRLSDDETRSG